MCYCNPIIRNVWCGSKDCRPPDAVKPRAKSENETKKQRLLRLLEEHAEHAQKVKRNSDLSLFQELIDYIENETVESNRDSV